ncbi:hypothetical protein PV797_11835 [Clostridiaceae bacterium M8S5]|nr:hypothetical protein PV797_11835 [Clostridiaceae bacterium M8S5]
MKDFRDVLKKRINLYIILILFSCVAVMFSNRFGSIYFADDDFLGGFIIGFQMGIFLCVVGFAFKDIYTFTKALKNESKLKELYTKEKDERNQYIKDKIGLSGFNITLVAVALATIISGFFDKKVFFILLSVLSFITLVKCVLKIYYNKVY